MTTPTRRPWLAIALTLALLIPAAAHVYAGSFSRLMADDFCTHAMGRDEGVVGMVVTMYNTWAGQYTNMAVKAVLGGWDTPAGWLPLGITAAWFAALAWAGAQVAMLLGVRTPFAAPLLAAAVLFATLDGSPLVIQSLYWLAANVPYTMPLILHTLVIGLLARSLRAPSPLALGLGALLCFIAGGFSEVALTLQLGALLAGLLVVRLCAPADVRRRALPFLLASLAASFAALIVLVIAPGSSARREAFDTPASPVSLVVSSLTYTFAFIGASLVSFSPAGAALIVGISGWIAARSEGARAALSKRRAFLLAIAGIVAVLLCGVLAYMAAGVYAIGTVPPARTYIIPQFALVLALAALGFAVGLRWRSTARRWAWVGAAALVALLIVGPLASTLRTLSWLPALSAHAEAWDARDRAIRAAADGAARLTVPPLAEDLALRVGLDTIGSDPTTWVNGCAAQYYGVAALIAADE